MFNYDLSRAVETQIREHKFAGLIDAREVAVMWEEIRDSIESLYMATDQLEIALNRQRYNEMNILSRYKQRLEQIEKRLAQSSITDIELNSDMECNPELYTCRMIYPGEDGKLILPEAKSVNYLSKALLEFGYRHGSYIEDNGIKNLTEGKQWKTIVQTAKPIVIGPSNKLYNVTSGVPFWLNIAFSQPRKINCIAITPGSWLPMDLVAVHICEQDGDEQVLLAPAGYNTGWQSTMLLAPVYMRFPYKTVTRVSLLMNQRHYTRQENAASRRVWYEYEYGLDHLFVGAVDYCQEGQWISIPIKTDGIINNIQIKTAEEQGFYPGANIAANIETSIEYDVSIDGRNWLPILPAEHNRVRCELLKVTNGNSGYTARLRFPVGSNLTIRQDRVPLKPGIDYSLKDSRTVVFYSQPTSILTAEYDPDESSQTVGLLTHEHLVQVTEEFSGTDEDGKITLSANMYVDYGLIETLPDNWNPSYLDGPYVPVKIGIRTADGRTITQPSSAGGDGIYNITPYRNSIAAMGQINYTCSGRTITFNQKLDRSSTIIVTYWKAPEEVRVRATLLRHARELTGITPEVGSIQTVIF